MGDFKQKFLTKFENKNNKKTIENLVAFVIILIATIIFINYVWNDDNNKTNNTNGVVAKEESHNSSTQNISSVSTSANTLENQLETILEKLQGVEDVSVLITYEETNKVVPIYNQDSQESLTQEEDVQGGVRTINQNSTKKEVVYEEVNGEKTIATSSVITPEIKGAVILAKGANNTEVKSNIIQAVEAATGLPTHKIQVFEMK